MAHDHDRVCPVEKAGLLDNRLRRLLQNPRKILKGQIREGMTVLDVGCGPGFFTIEMADMVGSSGRVIAADLQDGMLQIIKSKVQGTELESRITLHKCSETGIGVTEKIDLALVFYMLHEVPDQKAFLTEIAGMLSPDGGILVVEPSFHVSPNDFAASVEIAKSVGLTDVERPRVPMSKTVLLKKA